MKLDMAVIFYNYFGGKDKLDVIYNVLTFDGIFSC